MSERGGRRSMRNNIEEEAQLLAEEKWLIDTLKKVKEQLNCMQIERLHLMTLLEQYEESVKVPSMQDKNNSQTQAASHMLKTSDSHETQQKSQKSKVVTQHGIRSMGFEFDEATGEELDLSVSQSLFRQDPRYTNTMEEFEEEHDIDPEDANDNVFVDMHMLMDFQNDENF